MAVDEVLRREAVIAASNLSGSPEFKKILQFLEHSIRFNIERCITQADPVAINRAQGAVSELRDLQTVMKRSADTGNRRAQMRREV